MAAHSMYNDYDPKLVRTSNTQLQHGGTSHTLTELSYASSELIMLIPLVQITELLSGMTAQSVRIDVQTNAYEECKRLLISDSRFSPAAIVSEEPWFGIPFVAADIPPSILES